MSFNRYLNIVKSIDVDDIKAVTYGDFSFYFKIPLVLNENYISTNIDGSTSMTRNINSIRVTYINDESFKVAFKPINGQSPSMNLKYYTVIDQTSIKNVNNKYYNNERISASALPYFDVPFNNAAILIGNEGRAVYNLMLTASQSNIIKSVNPTKIRISLLVNNNVEQDIEVSITSGFFSDKYLNKVSIDAESDMSVHYNTLRTLKLSDISSPWIKTNRVNNEVIASLISIRGDLSYKDRNHTIRYSENTDNLIIDRIFVEILVKAIGNDFYRGVSSFDFKLETTTTSLNNEITEHTSEMSYSRSSNFITGVIANYNNIIINSFFSNRKISIASFEKYLNYYKVVLSSNKFDMEFFNNVYVDDVSINDVSVENSFYNSESFLFENKISLKDVNIKERTADSVITFFIKKLTVLNGSDTIKIRLRDSESEKEIEIHRESGTGDSGTGDSGTGDSGTIANSVITVANELLRDNIVSDVNPAINLPLNSDSSSIVLYDRVSINNIDNFRQIALSIGYDNSESLFRSSLFRIKYEIEIEYKGNKIKKTQLYDNFGNDIFDIIADKATIKTVVLNNEILFKLGRSEFSSLFNINSDNYNNSFYSDGVEPVIKSVIDIYMLPLDKLLYENKGKSTNNSGDPRYYNVEIPNDEGEIDRGLSDSLDRLFAIRASTYSGAHFFRKMKYAFFRNFGSVQDATSLYGLLLGFTKQDYANNASRAVHNAPFSYSDIESIFVDTESDEYLVEQYVDNNNNTIYNYSSSNLNILSSPYTINFKSYSLNSDSYNVRKIELQNNTKKRIELNISPFVSNDNPSYLITSKHIVMPLVKKATQSSNGAIEAAGSLEAISLDGLEYVTFSKEYINQVSLFESFTRYTNNNSLQGNSLFLNITTDESNLEANENINLYINSFKAFFDECKRNSLYSLEGFLLCCIVKLSLQLRGPNRYKVYKLIFRKKINKSNLINETIDISTLSNITRVNYS